MDGVNWIRLKLIGISYSLSRTKVYALMLADEEDHYRIPVIIGETEAHALAVQLEHGRGHRPLPHDLMQELMDKIEATLTGIYIHRWEAGVYFVEMHISLPRGEIKLDSRVSDAVAMALRFKAPIYIAGTVFEKTALVVQGDEMVLKETLEEERRLDAFTDAELTRLMEEAVAKEEYEKASLYRDELKNRKNKK
ncbi:MAG: bifunctional nuclease family protein [Odoribacteraceae bacterium]|jgi:bifunctional DNase/RNase|nr:bifunctional nuclease family protein [Odoribacteraceae bacterium]